MWRAHDARCALVAFRFPQHERLVWNLNFEIGDVGRQFQVNRTLQSACSANETIHFFSRILSRAAATLQMVALLRHPDGW